MHDECKQTFTTSTAKDGRDSAYESRSQPEGQQIEMALRYHESLTESLMEQVCNYANFNRAYKQVKANKGSPGVDGMTVDELRDFIAKHKETLIRSLLEGKYQPKTVRLVEIPKPDGGVRQLGIPTVVDRLVQQAILQVLQPIYELGFSNNSYGFRPKRSAHQAVKQAQKYVQSGYRVVVDMDLEKFFDRVNHDILMSRLARRIKDKRLLKTIRRFLEAGIMINGVSVERVEGTPQGGPLSPLLSNILLDDLDKELERRGHKFCRYADDCNIYVRSWQAGTRVFQSISQFLGKKLRLKVNEAKSGVASVSKRQFLGFRIMSTGKICLSGKSEERVKREIRKLTKRNRGVSLARVIEELNQKLRGWINYFKLVETLSKLQGLDGWIRRKLRCYRLKQRKRKYPIAKFMIDLGVLPRDAWNTAKSGKGWWRLSMIPAVQQAMSNDWFNTLKLINLEQQAKRLKTLT
jgi:RNA-directed DNA polymerase